MKATLRVTEDTDGRIVWEHDGETYWTSPRREGVFTASGQQRGLCDYSLRGLSMAAVRAKLRRDYVTRG
jgi:hypothetical protein